MREMLADPSCHYVKVGSAGKPFCAVRVASTETESAALHLGNPALIPAVLLNQGILGGTRNEYWKKHLFIS